ncbi:MAG: hypothetical protein J6Q67_02905, partial [Clostridia bacterium]|nr:hypothetical protein [Clostridia bacterium]
MKSRIICLCLCVVAVAVTVLMTVNLINSEYRTPPVISQNKREEEIKDKPHGSGAVELNDNAISSFADKVEEFVDRLAYGTDKEYEEELSYIIENLDTVSAYLADSKVG